MLRRKIALLLAVSMLVTGLLVVPAASASDYYSARTPLTGASQAKRNNIELAVQAISGAYIPYGGTFSFNQAVGPRTAERGFLASPNGRGAVVTGGGVAQVATTLYLALQEVRGSISFGPIQTYGSRFTDNYVFDGSQAIITDYNTGTDLSFTNYADAMSIDMWASDSYVYCSITVGDEAASDSGSWFTSPAAPEAPVISTRQLVASASINCGSEDNVLHNIRLASDSLNDTTLQSGNTFSFNDAVGPRLKKYGYKRGTNGRGARVVGGGVAQVATVLWLAVKNMDDISIVEKSTYGKRYNQKYVSRSSDAILTDYSSGRDFSFRYTGAGSITIYTTLEGSTLTCEIYRN